MNPGLVLCVSGISQAKHLQKNLHTTKVGYPISTLTTILLTWISEDEGILQAIFIETRGVI
jgi:hypothetical protein